MSVKQGSGRENCRSPVLRAVTIDERGNSMAKNIPFFDMFAELQLSGALRLKLAGAELTGAAIDQSALSISMSLTVRTAMSGEDLEDLKQMIQAV